MAHYHEFDCLYGVGDHALHKGTNVVSFSLFYLSDRAGSLRFVSFGALHLQRREIQCAMAIQQVYSHDGEG